MSIGRFRGRSALPGPAPGSRLRWGTERGERHATSRPSCRPCLRLTRRVGHLDRGERVVRPVRARPRGSGRPQQHGAAGGRGNDRNGRLRAARVLARRGVQGGHPGARCGGALLIPDMDPFLLLFRTEGQILAALEVKVEVRGAGRIFLSKETTARVASRGITCSSTTKPAPAPSCGSTCTGPLRCAVLAGSGRSELRCVHVRRRRRGLETRPRAERAHLRGAVRADHGPHVSRGR